MEKEDFTKPITKPYWMIHTVGDKYHPTISHTHGLCRGGHLELELNLPLIQKQAMDILNTIAFEIANGKTFKDNDVDNTLLTCSIVFKETKPVYGDEDDKVLRVILPDSNFVFPWEDGCEEPYKSQI